MTKQMKCATKFAKWLATHEATSTVSIYVDHKRYHVDENGDLVDDIDAEACEYLDYAGEIMSVSYEGELYDILNYSYGSEYYQKLEDELVELFKKFGYYFELCNSWSFTLAVL